MKNIIFIAPPAAGKGTQSDLLVKKYGYEHVSTGDMLRSEIAAGTELGKSIKNIIDKGDLVTDDIMINLIDNKFKMLLGKPFILDGFPRTLNQAESLQEILDDNYVAIYLDIDKEVLMKRIVGRVTCKCGKTYNIFEEQFKPKVEGICDDCGAALIKRDDDNEESFKVRYDTFIKNNAPILEFYQNLNKLYKIDASKSFEEIFEDIVKVTQI